MYRQQLMIETRGRGTYELTRQLNEIVVQSKVVQGLCFVFVHHTSASLIVCENADPSAPRPGAIRGSSRA